MKNYISQKGFKRLSDEQHQLLRIERPKVCDVIAWAAGNGDRSENADYQYAKRRLREIDRRLRFLSKRIEAAIIVDYLKHEDGVVRFGATVEIESVEERRTIIIVGEDEIDTRNNMLSLVSPFGRALIGKSIGDEVLVKTPQGDKEYIIEDVQYNEW